MKRLHCVVLRCVCEDSLSVIYGINLRIAVEPNVNICGNNIKPSIIWSLKKSLILHRKQRELIPAQLEMETYWNRIRKKTSFSAHSYWPLQHWAQFYFLKVKNVLYAVRLWFVAPWVLQVEPQANEQHFSQSVFLNDLTGIMIGDEVQAEELLLSSVFHRVATDDGVMGGSWRWRWRRERF